MVWGASPDRPVPAHVPVYRGQAKYRHGAGEPLVNKKNRAARRSWAILKPVSSPVHLGPLHPDLLTQDDLERRRVRGPAEDVVRLDNVGEREPVSDELAGVELSGPQQLEQRRRRPGVDKTRGDGDVADPELLQVEGGRLAVDADIGDVAARSNDPGAHPEAVRDADRLDRHIRAETVGHGLD